MARLRKLKPHYCHDKASDRAYVRLDGPKKTYLGDYGTQATRAICVIFLPPASNATPSSIRPGDSILPRRLLAGAHALGADLGLVCATEARTFHERAAGCRSIPSRREGPHCGAAPLFV